MVQGGKMSSNISFEKKSYLEHELSDVLDKSVALAASLGIEKAQLLESLSEHFPVGECECEDSCVKFNPNAGP